MRLLPALALCVACGGPRPASTPAPTREPARPGPVAVAVSAEHRAIRGARLPGGARVDLELRDGRVVAIGTVDAALPGEDAGGRFIAPAFVDSHVHLAYWPKGQALLAGGVAAAVDLGAPLAWLDAPEVPPALRLLASGPMITARRGYPTRDWGADGYGHEVGGPREAAAAVDLLIERGAALIKLPIAGAPVLGADALRAAVERAHARGLKVASHALGDAEARLAADVGVDVLAHTPVEPLQDATVAAWSGRAVISTLAAFGGAPSTIDNLRRLRAAGARVLYGTDLGNTREPAISRDEIELLRAAGLDGAAIVAAGTATPAAFWGLLDAGGGGPGALTPGGPASFLLLAADPYLEPETLATPLAVYVAGVAQGEVR